MSYSVRFQRRPSVLPVAKLLHRLIEKESGRHLERRSIFYTSSTKKYERPMPERSGERERGKQESCKMWNVQLLTAPSAISSSLFFNGSERRVPQFPIYDDVVDKTLLRPNILWTNSNLN